MLLKKMAKAAMELLLQLVEEEEEDKGRAKDKEMEIAVEMVAIIMQVLHQNLLKSVSKATIT